MFAIDDYQILETLSDNYRKSVYRCRDAATEDTFILKVLKTEFTGHEEVMRFKQEYRLLKELSERTSGVTKPLKLEEQNGHYIMKLEDIRGRSLKKILEKEKLGLDTLLKLTIKIVDIIGAIHEKNVIHKDIKPSNIIWNQEKDVVQVIDFDLAVKLVKEKKEFQNSGVLEGSLLYISPEQTGRMNRDIDYRTDYYSLGVCIYEMVTGVKPHESVEMLDQIYSIIAKETTSPYTITEGKISKALSDIIMKLLEKSSEDRYRSAYGLKADLKKCLAETKDFEIAKEDRLNIFQIPQKIYGREEDIERLVDAFRRSASGNPQMMLVSGDAGVGKTALVHELHKYISQEKGIFAEGKFDQYNRNTPYSAMIQAFRRLISQLQSSRNVEYKDAMKNSLLKALDGNGALITGLIPELESWIGVQPEIDRLNPEEETNRFFMTFAKFIEGITNNNRPLVLFLDDVQWADLSSLQLVEKLILNNRLRKFFVICSYRHNDIPQGHLIFSSINRLEKSREVGRIVLDSLSVETVESLIADTLCTDSGSAKELADVIHKRTKGNSFFVNEILKDLYKKGYLYFDDLKGAWSWDLNQILNLPFNDNVVDFLIMNLKNLPEDVRRILMLSASIGSLFDFNMLSLIGEVDRVDIVRSLMKAVDEDIILPVNSNYWIFSDYLEEEEDVVQKMRIQFRFQHDRIQQAFYQMLDGETSKRLHLTIGRLLLKHLPPEEIEENIMDIATHLNKGVKYILTGEETDQVILLTLKAARKAKAAFGYDSAFTLLEAARSLLTEDSWLENEQQTSEIYQLYTECGYLSHQLEAANEACSILLRHTRDNFAIAQIYEMQANHYTYLGMMKESIASGKLGLQAMGIKIPEKIGMASVLIEFLKVKASLRGRKIEDIYEKPEMDDSRIKLIMRLLINFIPPSFISGETALFGFVVLKKVSMTLKYGNSPESALAFIGYSILLSGFGDLKGAFDFGRLGIRINDKFNDLQWKGAANVLYTLFCHTWTEPWETLEDWYTTSIESSLRSGDMLYLAHACFYLNLWNPTMDIPTNLLENSKSIAMIENTKYKEALATAKLFRQQLLSLAGELDDILSLNDGTFSEKAYVEQLEEAKYYSGIAIYYIYKMKLHFTYESYKSSLEFIDKAYPIIDTLAGSAFMEEFALYTFLNLAYCYQDLNTFEKVKAKARMRKEFSRVKKWAKHSPTNFQQHEYLMKAEWARVFSGKDELAGKYYDLAIEASEKGDFVRYKALTNELAAKFYYSREYREFAAYLLRQALYYYTVWGAKGKIKHLSEQHPNTMIKINTKDFLLGKTITDFTESIDLNSMIMASQAISKEIDLNKLLEALMDIVIKNAGAQRGCIVMRSNSNLLVEGEYSPEHNKINVVIHDYSLYRNLPESILNHVEEKGESLIYNDAFSETQFVNDSYIVKHRPKSMVCMPLINQNKTIAIIYLENNLVSGVFTKERMKVINLLSREMVFSLENASLYSDLERSEEKYRELVNNLQDGIFITQDKKCKYVNAALADMLGYEMEEMIDQPFEKFISEPERKKVMHFYSRRFDGKNAPQEYETSLRYKDNTREVYVIHKVTIINYMDKPAIQGTVKDITERKKAEEELRRHKEHLEELVVERTQELELNNDELNKYIQLIEKISITDELTGLYNRRYFNKIFQEEVDTAARNKDYLTYIMLDIDYFKKYNDTYGHYEGDNILRKLGENIKEFAGRANGYVFRLGGEEFGIIVSGFTPQQSGQFAEGIRRNVEDLRIEHAMSSEYGIITVSIGVAVVTLEGLREEDIYKLGDDALYQSKARGRNCVTLLIDTLL